MEVRRFPARDMKVIPGWGNRKKLLTGGPRVCRTSYGASNSLIIQGGGLYNNGEWIASLVTRPAPGHQKETFTRYRVSTNRPQGSRLTGG